ncbi:MAG: SH3 domain-containing protein [Gammaproteobacteria bacterium]|jgi:uncharacterized protein YgiM (DUF1202 family)
MPGRTEFMYKLVLTVVLLALANMSFAADAQKTLLKVVDPYIELHTGPGRGYPIFYVAERGEKIQVLYRRTDWFKVRTKDNKEGWVSANQLQMTLEPSGKRMVVKDLGEKAFRQRSWEYGALVGNFGGASVISFYASYHFTENISTEISVSQDIGTASSSAFLGLNLVEEPFPEWTVSPFFSVGTGVIGTTPKTTLAASQNHNNQYADYALGARMHLTKRFLLRMEYRRYVVFSSRNAYEDIDEWKAGFGFFF